MSLPLLQAVGVSDVAKPFTKKRKANDLEQVASG